MARTAICGAVFGRAVGHPPGSEERAWWESHDLRYGTRITSVGRLKKNHLQSRQENVMVFGTWMDRVNNRRQLGKSCKIVMIGSLGHSVEETTHLRVN